MVRKISSNGILEYSSSYSDGSESESSSRCHSPVPQGSYLSLVDKMKKYADSGDYFFSLEFFPPRTKNGAANLLSQFDRMKVGGPLFCDITWHAAGSPGGDTETSSMTIAGAALNYCGLDTVLHLTCCNDSRDQITNHLRKARDIGIKSIIALRGDIPNIDGWKSPEDGLPHAVDLVRHIREIFGDYFVIGVAGYPNGHPESLSYESDLHYLKEKVDAGADFIISQLCFAAETFLSFVHDCRRIGITVPIIPGVMPIQSYDSIRQIAKLSKMDIPQEILSALDPIQGNDEAIRKFGIDQCIQLCTNLLSSGEVPGIHFYTLNREKATTAILKHVGLWNKSPHKPLPWPVAANHKRCTEDVRPIFWSTRPRSYVYRTQTWDEFPNGRWGCSESPAFGELRDYHLFFMRSKSPKDELLSMWGRQITCEEDIWNIFHCYVSRSPNKEGVMVTRIPWHDDELREETAQIADKLSSVNKRGILTINSQPNVNGAPSTHEVYGWGRPGGYVYQKAYIEFFTSKEIVESLKVVLKNYPHVNYHIVNSSGREDYTNCHKQRPIAVTWGVFPGLEIIQPTVVDPISFKVWKDEAFSLWNDPWENLYPEGCSSRTVIKKIVDEYCLVNLVDNNYPEDSCLWQLLEDVLNFEPAREEPS